MMGLCLLCPGCGMMLCWDDVFGFATLVLSYSEIYMYSLAASSGARLDFPRAVIASTAQLYIFDLLRAILAQGNCRNILT